MTSTSVYLSLPFAGMYHLRKCLKRSLLFGESFKTISKADILVAAAAVLILGFSTHNWLQSLQNVQTHLKCPSSINKPFNDCTFQHSRVKFHLLKKVVRRGEWSGWALTSVLRAHSLYLLLQLLCKRGLMIFLGPSPYLLVWLGWY